MDAEVQQGNGIPPQTGSQSVFQGVISPTDQATLLEFINKNRPTTSANGHSHGPSNTSIPNAFTPTKLLLTANDFANGITWDAADNRFSVSVAGQYLVIAEVSYTNTTTAKQYETMIYINGSEASQGRQTSAATGAQIDPLVSNIFNLSVGDFIELFTQHNDTGSSTISAGAGLTFLAIAKV